MRIDINWENNAIQFPRLLSEIKATQNLDMDALTDSMMLDRSNITELFNRAEIAWKTASDTETPAAIPVGRATPPTWWTMTVPCLSTEHISRETNNLLESLGDANPWMYCASYETGFFVSVPAESKFPDTVEAPPNDLVAIWDWARERNYTFVRIDTVGSDIDDLPSYSW